MLLQQQLPLQPQDKEVNMMILLALLSLFMNSLTYASSSTCLPLNFERGGKKVLASLSLDEKIGQLIMMAVPINDDDPALKENLQKWHWHPSLCKEYARELIEKYHIGSVLFIMNGTIATQIATTNYLNAHNASSLPLLFAADFEPGLNFSRITDAVPLPRAAEWGAVGDEKLLYELGKTLGHQAYAMGIQVVFAPVVDIHSNPQNPVINTRAFGTTPEKVISCAVPFMRGMEREGVLPVIKHAPGHGNTNTDSHKELPVIADSLSALNNNELLPFKTLIKLGAPAVMTGHLLAPAIDRRLPCSLSANMVQGILQKEFGFKGLVFCDALNMQALNGVGDNHDLAIAAFAAGTHQLVGPYDVPAACQALKEAVMIGDISEEELDERVAKIIRFKLLLPMPNQLDPEKVKKEVTSPEMYAALNRLRELQKEAQKKDAENEEKKN